MGSTAAGVTQSGGRSVFDGVVVGGMPACGIASMIEEGSGGWRVEFTSGRRHWNTLSTCSPHKSNRARLKSTNGKPRHE